jgi:hypothetical protein
MKTQRFTMIDYTLSYISIYTYLRVRWIHVSKWFSHYLFFKDFLHLNMLFQKNKKKTKRKKYIGVGARARPSFICKA